MQGGRRRLHGRLLAGYARDEVHTDPYSINVNSSRFIPWSNLYYKLERREEKISHTLELVVLWPGTCVLGLLILSTRIALLA